MIEVIFLYDIEFIAFKNSPGTKERFEDGLRAFFEAHGLDYGMSALGGMVRTRGHVRRKEDPVTLEDRQKLADWIKRQRVRCTVRLGDLEEETESTQYFRNVTECVFEVDNLSAEDQQQAAGYEARISQWTDSVTQDRRAE